MKYLSRNLVIAAAIAGLSASVSLSALAEHDLSLSEIAKLHESGAVKTYEQLDAAALEKHPGASIRDTDMEQRNGVYIYQVDLTDTNGVEWDVEVNAATGAVISDRQDD